MPATEKPTNITKRQTAIIEFVRRKGFAGIEDMAENLRVSAQTIRRDVIALDRFRLLHRCHGGASLPAGEDRLAYRNRRVRFTDEKTRIAASVAAHIPDGASLFIDIGTTTEAVATALLNHRGLRIITNHITATSILCENTDFEIILTGGMVRNHDRAVTGEATSEFLRRFRVEFAVFGIGAIDHEGQLLDYDYRDVHVSQAAMEISRRKLVVADHGKFNGDAMMHMAHVSQIDAIFTDTPPSPAMAKLIHDNGVEMHIADITDGSGA